MGFFDGIGSALASGGLSLIGGMMQNSSQADQAASASAASAQQAQENRDWQERMSNTSYQRAVKDMSAAGLNPMLAYQSGGAGTPSGATGLAFQAQMGNPLGSAVEAFNASRGTSADVEKKGTESELNKVAVQKVEADTDVAKANVANLAASTAEKLQNARTSSAVEARERVQAAAIQDQRARDSALAPLYNVLESATQWVKDKANKAHSAFEHGIRAGRREGTPENPRNITIYGNPK